MLIVVDHASNHVPEDIELGIDPALLREHVAWDIGAEALGRNLAARLGADVITAAVSRLVIDLNREQDAPGLIPAESDGYPIPGNVALSEPEREDRIERWWRPWHDAVAARIAARNPRMLVSLHSFTPSLVSAPAPRPWEIGVLYNRDDRAARIAIPLLEAAGIVTGDNLPYSGAKLNATMDRHGEANGIPYLGLEVRQDLIESDEEIGRWAARLAPIIGRVREQL